MKIKRPQYQQGSIRRVSKSGGFACQVRFSDRVNGRRPADGIRTRMSFSIKITAIRGSLLPGGKSRGPRWRQGKERTIAACRSVRMPKSAAAPPIAMGLTHMVT